MQLPGFLDSFGDNDQNLRQFLNLIFESCKSDRASSLSVEDWERLAERCPRDLVPELLRSCPVNSINIQLISDFRATITAFLSQPVEHDDINYCELDSGLLDAVQCFCSAPLRLYTSFSDASQVMIHLLLRCFSIDKHRNYDLAQIRKSLVSEGLKQVLICSTATESTSTTVLRLWRLIFDLTQSQRDLYDCMRIIAIFLDYFGNDDVSIKMDFLLQMLNDDHLYEAVIKSMISKSNSDKKIGIYILIKVIEIISVNMLKSQVKTKYLLGCSLDSSVWSDFQMVYEVFDQTSNHLVEPVLPLFIRLASTGSMGFGWIKVLLQQCANNKNNRVQLVIYKYLMKHATDANFKFYADNFDFFFTKFAKDVGEMSFFAEANTSLDNVSEFGELLESFLAQILSKIQRDGLRMVFKLMKSDEIFSFKVVFTYYLAGISKYCNSSEESIRWSHAEIIDISALKEAGIQSSKFHDRNARHILVEILFSGLDAKTAFSDILYVNRVFFAVISKQQSCQSKIKSLLEFRDYFIEFHEYVAECIVAVAKMESNDMKVLETGENISRLIMIGKDPNLINSCLNSLAMCKIHRKPHIHENVRLLLKTIFVDLESFASEEEKYLFFSVFKNELVHVVLHYVNSCIEEERPMNDLSLNASIALLKYRNSDLEIRKLSENIASNLSELIIKTMNSSDVGFQTNGYLRLLTPGILAVSTYLTILQSGNRFNIRDKWLFVIECYTADLEPYIRQLIEFALDDLDKCTDSDVCIIFEVILFLLHKCDSNVTLEFAQHIVGTCAKAAYIAATNTESILLCYTEILTCDLFCSNEKFLDILIEAFENLFNFLGTGKTSVVLHFARRLTRRLSLLSPESLKTSLENVFEMLYNLLIYGFPRDRFERFDLVLESKIEEILKMKADELSERLVIEDSRVRACALSFLINFGDLRPDIATMLIGKLIEKLQEPKSKSFQTGFSLQNREKLRICQTILILIDKVKNETDSNRFLLALLDFLKVETFGYIRIMLQWIIIRLILKFPKFFDHVPQYLDLYTGKVSECVSALSICSGIYEQFSNSVDSYCKNWTDKLPHYLFPAMIHNKHVVRLYAFNVVKIARKNDSFADTEYSRMYVRFIETNHDVLKEQTRLDDPLFSEFDNEKCFNLQWIFCRFLQIIGAPFEEIIRPRSWSAYLCASPSLIAINDERKLPELLPSTNAFVLRDSADSLDISAETLQFQKKFEPQQELALGENSRLKNHAELVVVASLLDKATNLGGLCRTCEIFGGSLVLSNLKTLQDKTFQTMSVTSESWVNVSEVKVNDLSLYFQNIKKQGYSIVAIEQAAKSSPLTNFKFPKKTVLLLGAEKQGIPVNLLDLVDFCVEIPQYGMIRSLNVHVAASLCIYEYIKQYPTKK